MRWLGRITGVAALAAAVATAGACSSGTGRSTAATSTSAAVTSTAAAAPSTTASSGGGGADAGATTTTAADVTPGPADGPVPSGFRPQSVTFVSSNDGWVLGTATCRTPPCTSVLRTVDAGRTWHGIPAPHVAISGTAGVAGLRFASRTDGWAFGAKLYATHDGGGSWNAAATPGNGKVVALEASGGTAYAYIVQPASGPAPGQLFRSPAGQDSWTPVPGTSFTAVESASIAVRAGRGWLSLETGDGGGTYLRSNDGASWAPLPSPCPSQPSGTPAPLLAAGNDDTLFAVCGDGVAAGQQKKMAFVSHDAGATFSPVSTPPDGGDLVGVAAASPTTIVVSAASGASELYASFDGGRSWNAVVEDATRGGAQWRDVGFTTPAQGVAIEGAVDSADSRLPPPRMLLTRDGGRTWPEVAFRAG